MNALSTLTALPTTPAERRSFIEMAKDEIINGKYKIVDIYPQLKAIEKLIEEMTKDIEFRDMLSSAICGKMEVNGLEISEQTVKKYNYAECHDSEWMQLQTKANELKEKIKKREEFLKNVPTNGVILEDTGEMIYPPMPTFETRFTVKPIK